MKYEKECKQILVASTFEISFEKKVEIIDEIITNIIRKNKESKFPIFKKEAIRKRGRKNGRKFKRWKPEEVQTLRILVAGFVRDNKEVKWSVVGERLKRTPVACKEKFKKISELKY